MLTYFTAKLKVSLKHPKNKSPIFGSFLMLSQIWVIRLSTKPKILSLREFSASYDINTIPVLRRPCIITTIITFYLFIFPFICWIIVELREVSFKAVTAVFCIPKWIKYLFQTRKNTFVSPDLPDSGIMFFEILVASFGPTHTPVNWFLPLIHVPFWKGNNLTWAPCVVFSKWKKTQIQLSRVDS